ncbi:hypothetical protein [Sansalvadorimonas verongulae]|uniref:hypothetical protein n=1 Tax=Sansalvadorimonas verongulae TaxID=2172824 RepID=UPI0012BB731F|nr:hypothetical protein [Sansalvadorimonas verongulae]MTI14999.1 hypothetical protein [Sansalvadorimonas verongulae]
MEYAQADDPCLDFCLWPYEPLVPQSARLRSVNLLYNSFRLAGAEHLIELCQVIRKEIGDFQTVWGIKQSEQGLSWELYFYDYQRLERAVSASRLIEILSPWFRCDLKVNESSPYFMFSIDLERDTLVNRHTLEEVNIYIGNAGSQVSSGMSYCLNANGLRFDNLYSFFDMKNERDDVYAKLTSSVHLDWQHFRPEQVLWPELMDCQTAVIANKRLSDGVYFSRITVEQLLFFLSVVKFSANHVAYVYLNREFFRHLLFDVGFDYTMTDNRIIITKCAYYGVF